VFSFDSVGKTRLKYEMKSYQEMVVNQIRQISEDNQQLLYFKNKVVKEKKHSKAMDESFGIVTQKLRKTMEENRIVRRRTKMQHEEIKEEVILTSDTLLDAYFVYVFFYLIYGPSSWGYNLLLLGCFVGKFFMLHFCCSRIDKLKIYCYILIIFSYEMVLHITM
jgi:hypothetical protein